MAGRIRIIVAYYATQLTTCVAISFVFLSLTSLYSFQEKKKLPPKWSLIDENQAIFAEEVRLLDTKIENLGFFLDNKILSMAMTADLDSSHPAEPPRVNYLSYYQGAKVIPYPTSPSVNAGSRRKAWWMSFFGMRHANWKFRKPFTPANALTPWYEAGQDAFCGPPTRGVLQLAVILPRRMYPTEFVVEHWPRTEYSNTNIAPMDVEFWIEVVDKFDKRHLLSQFPGGTIMRSNYEPRQKGRFLLSAEGGLATDEDLWAPVGALRYDVYADEHVQTYKIPKVIRDILSTMVPPNKVAVRVVSNWGDGNVTCLARVKLYGLPAEGTEEKLDPPEGWMVEEKKEKERKVR